jgi:hypothetical protein
VSACEDRRSHVEPYRRLYAQLSMPTDFQHILMVLAGGRVEVLTGNRRETRR